MKKPLATVIIALCAAGIGTQALADGPHGWRNRPHNEYRHRAPNWLGPLVVLGVAGAAIHAINSNTPTPQVTYTTTYVRPYVPPQVTYVTPSVTYNMPPPPPANVRYFCNSVGQFYPHTPYCPEGWQPIYPER